MKKLLGAAFVLLWLATVVLVVMWDQNLLGILACALGVTAALLVTFRLRWRRGIGAVASVLFVVNWGQAFFQMGAGAPFETYVGVVQRAAESANVTGAVIIIGYEAVLPVVHAVVAVALTVGLVRRK